ncbi:hypothetical protein GCM10023196_041780 [Actinoallomurus vinaceus]|uniref:Uncharacterized protein n=1 Tax=Actinoallomurus vinaceus TaxID=1080074 RepID=A0ABP8UAP8_9ACTN
MGTHPTIYYPCQQPNWRRGHMQGRIVRIPELPSSTSGRRRIIEDRVTWVPVDAGAGVGSRRSTGPDQSQSERRPDVACVEKDHVTYEG